MSKKRHRHQPAVSAAPTATVAPEPTQRQVVKAADNRPDDDRVVASLGILLVHVAWFFICPLLLLLILFSIANVGSGWATVLDIVFFAMVGLMVGCRWLDQRLGQGMTIYGEPSTWADFRRFALLTPVVMTAAWIAANMVGNHFPMIWGGP